MIQSLNVKWKPIPGFHGYEVSNEGEVRTFRKRGRGTTLKNVPTRVTPFYHGAAHRWAVKMSPQDGPRAMRLIATLVLISFGVPIPKNALYTAGRNNQPDVGFRDGNPLNCYLKNLYWKTNP